MYNLGFASNMCHHKRFGCATIQDRNTCKRKAGCRCGVCLRMNVSIDYECTRRLGTLRHCLLVLYLLQAAAPFGAPMSVIHRERGQNSHFGGSTLLDDSLAIHVRRLDYLPIAAALIPIQSGVRQVAARTTGVRQRARGRPGRSLFRLPFHLMALVI